MRVNLRFLSNLVNGNGDSTCFCVIGDNKRHSDRQGKRLAVKSRKFMLEALLLIGTMFSVNGQGSHCGSAAADWVRLRAAVNTISSGQTIKIHTKSSGITEVISGSGIDYDLVLCNEEDFIESDGAAINISIGKAVTIASADPINGIITLLTPLATGCATGNSQHFGILGNLTLEYLILDGDNNA